MGLPRAKLGWWTLRARSLARSGDASRRDSDRRNVKLGIEPIKAGHLQVDREVQRQFSKPKAERMSASWNESAVGVLIVSRRGDGAYFIIDGQHRHWSAVDAVGLQYEFMCEVHVGLSLADEARMFLDLNTLRTLPNAYDKYRISLMAEDPEAIGIQAALKSLDLAAGVSAGTDRVGALIAVSRIYRQLSTDGLRATLAIAIEAFGRSPDTYDADILQAIANLLKVSPGLDRKRLARKLNRRGRVVKTPADWKRSGAEIARVGGSTSRASSIARMISEAYDSGLVATKRIDYR
jgi:hypothetical protein